MDGAIIKVKLDWHPDKYIETLREQVKRNILKIAMSMVRDIKSSMKSTGKGGKEIGMKGHRRTKTGKRHYPSQPGQPPAVDSGRLRASISCNWTGSGLPRGATDGGGAGNDGVGAPPLRAKGDAFIVVVGTNVLYGAYLELGAPRHNLLPRPYLRPIYEKYQGRIMDAMKGK